MVLEELDQIQWKVGSSHLSVRTLIEGGLTAGLVMLLTLWVSSAIEARLLRTSTGSELSLRKAVSNAVTSLLMFVGLMVSLSAVGIDLTALSVLGGAVGVGMALVCKSWLPITSVVLSSWPSAACELVTALNWTDLKGV